MSHTDSIIQGDSLRGIAATLGIVREAASVGDTDITMLRDGDGEPFGAIVTPDVVAAARLWWEQIQRETMARGGLGSGPA